MDHSTPPSPQPDPETPPETEIPAAPGGQAAPPAPPAGRRWSRLLLGLVLALALLAPAFFLAKHLILEHRLAAQGAPVVVEIPRGLSTVQVGEMLEKAGVIDHPWLFALASRLLPQPGRLRAGEYAFSPAMTQAAILEAMIQGRVVLHQVLIPEGFNLAQILDRFADEHLLDRQAAAELARDPEFLTYLGLSGAGSLEGYLFPDTYRFPKGMATKALLAALVRRFHQEWEPLAAQAKQKGLTRRQVLILASIVEREAKLPAERPLVAAVYLNRLKLGMKLQADPTVIYGVKEQGSSPITRADLERDTPYNTYVREGLPPGPICSPGQAAMWAVLNPAPVDYLYFVARGDGGHVFSTDYQGQVNNVNRYQRRRTP